MPKDVSMSPSRTHLISRSEGISSVFYGLVRYGSGRNHRCFAFKSWYSNNNNPCPIKCCRRGGRNQPRCPVSSEDRTFRVPSQSPSCNAPGGAVRSQGSLSIPLLLTTKASFCQAHFPLHKSLPRKTSHKVQQHGIKSWKQTCEGNSLSRRRRRFFYRRQTPLLLAQRDSS